jgi:predicted Zn-dependent protease
MAVLQTSATSAPKVERTSPLLIAALLLFAIAVVAIGYELWLMRWASVSAMRNQLLHDPRVQAEFGPDARLQAAVGWSLGDITTVYAYVRSPQAQGLGSFELYPSNEGWKVLESELYDVTEDHLITFTPVSDVAGVEQLHGTGRVYLVALGSSASGEVKDLAAFLERESGVHLEILPAMDLPEAAYHTERKQWVADMLLDAMTEKFPDIAADRDARIIGVIDGNIYPRNMGWAWTFSFRYANKYAVVQTALLDPGFNPKRRSSRAIQTERLRKIAMKCLGMLYFGFDDNPRPESVMSVERSLYNIDLANAKYLRSDVATQRGRKNYSGQPCLGFTTVNLAGVPRLEPIQACHEANDISLGSYYYVDLPHGEFRTERNDAYGAGPEAFILRRMYASHSYDGKVRSFGKSTWFNLDDTVWSTDPQAIQTISIYGVEFHRITPGTGFAADAKYVAPPSASEFGNALLTWDNDEWKIQNRIGTVWHYLGCDAGSAIPCYFLDKTNAYGDRIAVQRDGRGHIVNAIQSAGRDMPSFYDRVWKFIYNGDTVQRVEDSNNADIRYLYDNAGFLRDVQSDHHVLHYDYDEAHRMNRVVDDGHVLEIQYDAEGRVVELDAEGRPMYRVRYTGETIEVSAPEHTYVLNVRYNFFELSDHP